MIEERNNKDDNDESSKQAGSTNEDIQPSKVKVTEIHPEILSVSRATDIPAFYSKWFINRLDAGSALWVNPFNRNQRQKVFFDKTRAIVFWTKNPKPLMNHLSSIDDKIPNYYFQYTLNDYEKEGLEPGLAPLGDRISVFKELSDRIGKEKVIWRFDPLILSDELTIDELLRRIENIAKELHEYTAKLVISFVDITAYKKVERNLGKQSIKFREFDENQMVNFMDKLVVQLEPYELEIATCGEKIEHNRITHNRCIDGDLMVRLFHEDTELMEYLGYEIGQKDLFGTTSLIRKKQKKLKDPGQRESCGCIKSKDIGSYDTCMHLCTYCYANAHESTVRANYDQYMKSEGMAESILPLKD